MHTGVEGAAMQSFLQTIKAVDEEGGDESVIDAGFGSSRLARLR